MSRLPACALLLLCSFAPFASSQTAKPGAFDLYLLTLSWSPEYCHSHSTPTECAAGRHFGFIVHGLWPEFQNGGYPENCSNAPGPTNPGSFLNIMPDLSLIQHEWTTHGTCTGLSADSYFGLIRTAFMATKIPTEFSAPHVQQTFSAMQIRSDFERVNPGLRDANLSVQCSGSYLTAVEICLTKGLTPAVCPALHSCTSSNVRVAPVP